LHFGRVLCPDQWIGRSAVRVRIASRNRACSSPRDAALARRLAGEARSARARARLALKPAAKASLSAARALCCARRIGVRRGATMPLVTLDVPRCALASALRCAAAAGACHWHIDASAFVL
jgi:hypothetical protein